MSQITDEQPWKCAGCGKEAIGLVKPCKCPTDVAYRGNNPITNTPFESRAWPDPAADKPAAWIDPQGQVYTAAIGPRAHTMRPLYLRPSAEHLAAFIDFVKNAPVYSGVCCCGDSMQGHADPMTAGHTPVDRWDYSLSLWLDKLA